MYCIYLLGPITAGSVSSASTMSGRLWATRNGHFQLSFYFRRSHPMPPGTNTVNRLNQQFRFLSSSSTTMSRKYFFPSPLSSFTASARVHSTPHRRCQHPWCVVAPLRRPCLIRFQSIVSSSSRMVPSSPPSTTSPSSPTRIMAFSI